MATKRELRAFVVGYTGQIGQKLVDELAASDAFSRVNLIGRKEVEELKTEKYAKFVQHVVDFDDLSAHEAAFQDNDVGFCTLGTTRGKSGVEGFKKVDFDYVLSSAKTGHSLGVKEFHLVTAQNANKDSSFLYPQTKGLVEEAVKEVGFDRLYIYHPSFLAESNRSETRIAEVVVEWVLFPIIKLFPTAISIPIAKVAKAMSVVAATRIPENDASIGSDGNETKVARIFDNKETHQIADGTFPEFCQVQSN